MSSAKTQKKPQANHVSEKKTFRYAYEVIIFAFSFLLFASGILNNYNLDDELVTQNHRLTSQGISAIPEIFTSNYYQDQAGYKYEYRPIVLVSFAVEHQFLGENPHTSHFINVLLYALLCTLLFITLRALFRGYSALFPFLTLLIYIAHPTHTEIVDSIKNRDEILALGFATLAIYYSLKWLDQSSWIYLLVSLLFVPFAVLSKFSIVPTCIVIPLLILYFRNIKIRDYAILCLTFIVPVLILSPSYNVKNQVSILLACTALYSIAYIVFKTNLRELFLSVQSKNKIQVEKTIIASNTNDVNISIDSRKSIITGIGSLTLSLSALYLYFSTESYYFILPTIILCLFHFFINESYQKITTPFIAITGIIIAYFINDRARIVGFSVISILAISIYYYKLSKSTFNLLLAAAVIIILWQYNDIKLFFIILSFPIFTNQPSLRRFATPIFLFFLSGLLFIKPFLQIFTNNILSDDLTLGIPVIVTLFLLIQKGTPLLKIRNGIVFTLPIFLLISVFDFDHNTFCIFRHLNSQQISEVRKWVQKDDISNSILLFKGQAVKVKEQTTQKAQSIKSNIDQAGPVSLTQNIISQSKRPITFMEQPVATTDPLLTKLATGADLMLRYIRLAIIPYPLGFYYGYSIIHALGISEPIVILALILIAIVGSLALFYILKRDILGISLTLFLLILLPFTSFIIPVAGAFADRFLFVPTLFVSIILVRAFFHKKENYLTQENLTWSTIPSPIKYLTLLLCLIYSMMTLARTTNWKDHLTLYRHDIAHLSNSAQAQNLLALRIISSIDSTMTQPQQMELYKEALTHLRRSIEIYPSYINTNLDMGRTFQEMNEPDSAIYWYQKTIAVDSNFTDAYYKIADVNIRIQRPNLAIPYLEKVIAQAPKFEEAYDKLGGIYYYSNRHNDAIDLNKLAIKNMPDKATAYLNISKIYALDGNKDSSYLWIKKTLAINPQNQEAKLVLEKLGYK